MNKKKDPRRAQPNLILTLAKAEREADAAAAAREAKDAKSPKVSQIIEYMTEITFLRFVAASLVLRSPLPAAHTFAFASFSEAVS